MNEPISRAVQMCGVCSGKIGPRSCGKEVDEPFETCHGPLPAEQREHLEQSGTGGTASNCYARGMDEHSGLDAPFSCRSSHRSFHMWLIEGIRRPKCGGEHLNV